MIKFNIYIQYLIKYSIKNYLSIYEIFLINL